MALEDRIDFSVLVNQAEKWVIEEVEEQLSERPEVCSCDDCVLDMVALALNHIKPAYRATLLGAIYGKDFDESVKKEVSTSVRSAIEKINENPSCSSN